MEDLPLFDRIVAEGKGMAFWGGKALFCIGPLPGEKARVSVTREKRRWAEGIVDEFVVTSPHRHEAKEQHYLSCSPWQGVDYDYQIELKRGMLEEIFGRPELKLDLTAFKESPERFGYRNKIEFSLVATGGPLELAFHKRGRFDEFVLAPMGCVLASDAMNLAARNVRDALRNLPVENIARTLTVRQGTNGEVVCILQLDERIEFDWTPLGSVDVSGIAVVVKTGHLGNKKIWSKGRLDLVSEYDGLPMSYPWDAFSQVNPPAFSQALSDIVRHITPGTFVVDLYGGAGTIGLPVARVAGKVVGIEIVESAVRLANANAVSNDIPNYKAYVSASEKLDPELVRGADTVIVDPPRAGLGAKVVDYLLAARPQTILYLSCNPVTQARDVLSLALDYEAVSLTGYDFYPGTLHMESLVVLRRKASV